MIATTSVPAIFALSGLGFSMALVTVYMVVIFITLAGILWPALYFSGRLVELIFHHD